VRALRGAGDDVVAIAEISPGAVDEAVIELAVREARIVLTEDKDFGRLVYATRKNSSGVILIRYPPNARSAMPQAIVDLIREEQERLVGSFVVASPGLIRISLGPDG
jgi:predicted nuclease of predicted toxin-antitoxin system